MEKKNQFNIWYAAIAVFLVLLFQSLWLSYRSTEPIPYSEFEVLLKKGEIEEVVVKETTLQGKLKTPRDGRQYFITRRVDPAVAKELAEQGVTFTGGTENTFLRDLMSWVLPVIFFFALWMFFFRKVAEKQGFGGLMSVGKSKAKVYVEKETGVTFDDVAGVDEAKAELEEIVQFLQDPERYGRLGARIPKGILLVGPPGTGKTLLARAVAGQAGVPFFSISGSEFVEMFVGVGAARVRDLFEQARKTKPCIIFIDELDALGRARGAVGGFGGHDEKEQTLNQLLSELDGFDPREGIVILAATNRPEILDPALMRAGRFDRQILVDRPDKSGREAILIVHLKKVKVGAGVDLEQIAAITPGFSGADLENLVNEAALIATRRGAEKVTMDDFTQAVERLVAGIEKRSRVLNERERAVVAHHEMGHALVAASVPGADPVHKVSIIPRGIGALGYTLQRPTEDRFLISTGDLEGKMTVLLGGRAAERLIFDEISTGAADDLDKATEIARQMVTRFGMTEALGQAVYEPQRQAFLGEAAMSMKPKEYSEETAREIDLAVRKLVDAAFLRAVEILTARRKELEDGARLLLDKETLTPDDYPPLLPAGDRRRAAE
ncbi:MAG: ATP-dependent zinc metalloprotease FtsH [Methyloligellaceae bacterium]